VAVDSMVEAGSTVAAASMAAVTVAADITAN
jgi:hypothetical protein